MKVKRFGLFHVFKTDVLKYWRLYLVGVFSLFLTNWLMVEVPKTAKIAIDSITQSTSLQQNLGLYIVIYGVLIVLMRTLSRVFFFFPARYFESDFRQKFFDKTLRHHTEFFEKFGMGDLVTRFSSDIGSIRVFFGFGMLQALNISILVCLTLFSMLKAHVTLTILCLLPMFLMFICTKLAMPRLHKLTRASQDTAANLNNRTTEALSHIGTIQASSAEASFVNLVHKESENLCEANMKLLTLRVMLFPLMILFGGLSYLIVIYYGGHQVIEGEITVGDLLAFIVYIGLLLFPLTAIGILLAMLQRAKSAMDRLAALQNAEVETASKPEQNSDRGLPLLHVENLSWKWPNDELCLQHIDFSIEKGEWVGVVGPVGSGKSTLFDLITRIYQTPKESIFFHGKDICTYEPTDLRKGIGYAMQTVELLSMSIRDNISLGASASEEHLSLAASKACILDEIEGFADGWNTQIGEKGVRLSGGQKQRLALARVFLRKYDLVILDDVLSAVDQLTEAKLTQSLKALDCAVLVSSHRRSLLEKCAKVIVLDKGCINTIGSFKEVSSKFPHLLSGETDGN